MYMLLCYVFVNGICSRYIYLLKVGNPRKAFSSRTTLVVLTAKSH